MAINIKLFKETIIRTLALLIFDRNLIPMPYPVITRINFRFSKMWKFVTGEKHLLLGIDQPVQNFPLTIKPKIKIILIE